jgi:hypothetical protein
VIPEMSNTHHNLTHSHGCTGEQHLTVGLGRYNSQFRYLNIDSLRIECGNGSEGVEDLLEWDWGRLLVLIGRYGREGFDIEMRCYTGSQDFILLVSLYSPGCPPNNSNETGSK